MAFTNAQRVAIRRYCGYPLFGSTITPAFGYRYFQSYGDLEYRMTNLTSDEEAVVTTVYLANLPQLETDIFAVRENMDTKQAAVWIWNGKEFPNRRQLYNYVRLELCAFFGVPPGPGLNTGGVGFAV
jgi:hypothetical protein